MHKNTQKMYKNLIQAIKLNISIKVDASQT